MEDKYFNIIKPIISNVICNTVVACGGKISSERLNELSNVYTDKIIGNIKQEDLRNNPKAYLDI